MGPLQVLAQLLGSGVGKQTRASHDNGALAVLERMQIVRAAGALDRIVCDNCDEPHGADVRRSSDGWRIRCRDHGWLKVEEAEVAAIEVDFEALAGIIAAEMAAKGRVRQIGDLWSLGRAMIRDGAVATLFLTPAADTLSRVAAVSAVVAREPQADVSVVISGWTGGAAVLFHPSIRFVALEDVCTIDERDRLEIDIPSLADIVLGPVVRKRRGGRPVKYGDDLTERIEQIWRPGGPRPTSRAVIEEHKRRWPEHDEPSTSTTNRALRNIEARRRTTQVI